MVAIQINFYFVFYFVQAREMPLQDANSVFQYFF